MKHILNNLLLYIALGSYLTEPGHGNYESKYECVIQSVTSNSTWACGYCLDVEENGGKRTMVGLEMEKTECEENGKHGNIRK